MYFQSEQLSGLLSLHQNSRDFWINWHLNDWNCVALNRNMTFIKQIKWSIVSFFLLNDSYVELEGVEPSSKQGNHMLSTCLSLLKFSCCSKTKATNCCLILCFFATRTRLRATIPDLSAPLYQIASGRGHLRDVSSWHLVSGWSLIYSIRLSSKSVIIFASYCFEIRDLRAGIPTLDMLTYLFYLLSKPNSPKNAFLEYQKFNN